MELTVTMEVLRYYMQLERETGVPCKRLMRRALEVCAREQMDLGDLSDLAPYGRMKRDVSRFRHGEYEDFFEVRVVVDEDAVARDGQYTLAQVMREIQRMAAREQMYRNDDGALPNVMAFASDQSDRTSLARAWNFGNEVLGTRELRGYIKLVRWYDAGEDGYETWTTGGSKEEE